MNARLAAVDASEDNRPIPTLAADGNYAAAPRPGVGAITGAVAVALLTPVPPTLVPIAVATIIDVMFSPTDAAKARPLLVKNIQASVCFKQAHQWREFKLAKEILLGLLGSLD